MRALALSGTGSVLVSGGESGAMHVYSSRRMFVKGTQPIACLPLPGHATFCVAAGGEGENGGFLLWQSANVLQLWTGASPAADASHDEGPRLAAELRLAGGAVLCSAISPDGRMLAVSMSEGGVRMFAVTAGGGVAEVAAAVSSALPDAVDRCIFAPDSSRVYWGCADGSVAATALEDGQVGATAVLANDAVAGDGHAASVTALAICKDGSLLAAADSSHRVIVYDTAALKAAHGTPAWSSPVVAVAFDSEHHNELAVALLEGELVMWSTHSGNVAKWARSDRSAEIKAVLSKQRGAVQGIIPVERKKLILWSAEWMVVVDFHGEPKTDTALCPLLFLGATGRHSLVSVERSWLAVLSDLPEPVFRRRYGRS